MKINGYTTEQLEEIKSEYEEEIRGLFKKAQDEEIRAIVNEKQDLVEEIQKEIEKRNTTGGMKVEDNKLNDKEIEMRGLEQLIRGTDGEELRTLQTSSQGAIIPTVLSKDIIKKLDEVAPLYGMIPKLTPVNGYLEILKEGNFGEGGFVGEYSDLNKADLNLTKVKLEQRRAGAALELTQQLINDAGIDVVSYATDILYRRLGYALDRTVIVGKVAKNQFEGLVNSPEECNVETSVKDVISIDDFMDCLNAMHPSLQDGAVWIVGRPTFNKLTKLKDGNGNFFMLREKNVVTNKPEYRLFGNEVIVSDVINKIEVGSVTNGTDGVVAYLVNFNRAYAGMIKKGIEFSNISGDTQNRLKGMSTLMIDIYTDCKIVDPQAIRVLRNKAV